MVLNGAAYLPPRAVPGFKLGKRKLSSSPNHLFSEYLISRTSACFHCILFISNVVVAALSSQDTCCPFGLRLALHTQQVEDRERLEEETHQHGLFLRRFYPKHGLCPHQPEALESLQIPPWPLNGYTSWGTVTGRESGSLDCLVSKDFAKYLAIWGQR